MRKILSLLTLLLALGSAQAKTNVPYYLRTKTHYRPISFLTPYLDDYGASTWSYTQTPYQTINDVRLAYTPGSSGGTLAKTDAYGTSIEITWSISGSTLNWSVNVVPGANVVMNIHTLYFYKPYTNDYYVFEDYEDEFGLGYGNTPWVASGSADIGTSQEPIAFSFENYTSLDNTGSYMCNTKYESVINFL